jgi:hypothetical protein
MKRPARLVLAFLVCALSASAQESMRFTAMPRATLLELAAQPDRARPVRGVRNEKRNRPMTKFAGGVPQRKAVATAATIDPPPIAGGFENASSGRVNPADAGGAVGPNHVVAALNTGIIVQTREGKIRSQLSLNQFWSGSTRDLTYDPRVSYDPLFDRWVTVAIDDGHTVLVAASVTGDPLGEWHRYSLKLKQNSDIIEFTRLALTRDTITVVTEYVSFSSCIVLSIQKSDLYAGGASVPVKVDDSHGSSSMVVPVDSPDSDVEYLLTAHFAGSISIRNLEWPQWQNMTSKIDWDPGWFFAKQRDSGNELDFGFDELTNAVMRNGVIYTVMMIGVPDTRGRTALLWSKINPQTRTIIEQGVIDDGTTYYGFPSLAVNRHGAMLISYSTSSRIEYPSARYVFIDAQGRQSREAVIKEGNWSINDTDRWGDYTTTVVDPTDDSMFWTLQMYADTGHWATWWAKVKAPAGTNRRRSARH